MLIVKGLKAAEDKTHFKCLVSDQLFGMMC